MRIAVTVGDGYTGSVISEVLIGEGHDVIVIDEGAARMATLDIASRAAVAAALSSFGTEAVIHAAAASLVGESVTQPATYYAANVVSSLALLDAMAQADVHELVLSSTAAVDGEPDNNLGWGGRGSRCVRSSTRAAVVTGRTIPVSIAGRRAGDPAVLIASAELARSRLGWELHHQSLEAIVAPAWAWMVGRSLCGAACSVRQPVMSTHQIRGEFTHVPPCQEADVHRARRRSRSEIRQHAA
jgi:UDP-glucose 4-epimerase